MNDPTSSRSESDHGVYVFCFARAGAVDAAGPGLDEGAPVRALVHADVAALYCEVPLRDWVGPEGEAHLQDPAWIAPRALRHEAVVEEAMRASPVLPLRFGCLFSSPARLVALVAAERQKIAVFLAEAEQREEWSIKGSLDVAACEAAMFAADPRAARLPASPGARYLMEQKLRLEAQRAARAWVRSAEAEIEEALGGVVLDRRVLRPSARQAGSGAREGVFHWAVLVPRGGAALLQERLGALGARLEASGLSVEAFGPWPLYTFAPHLGEEGEGPDPAGDPARG
jgi:hypothetical protein